MSKLVESMARFVYGGAITAATGYVAHRAGPVVGGLFLGFPAILPASLTLVRSHDGRRRACDDARGAIYGSLGMIGFGVVVWLAPPAWGFAVVLALAGAVWLAVAALAWLVAEGVRPST